MTLPFLPGRYDSLAMPLALMTQLFGWAGLVLVPPAALWLAAEHWQPLAGKRKVFALASLGALCLVLAVVLLGALMESMTFGVVCLILAAWLMVRLFASVLRLRPEKPAVVSATPLYLITLPLAVVLFQLAFGAALSDSGRDRAMRNSEALIRDIESYRSANGRYPQALVSLWQDHYAPSLIGIRKYEYEASGDAYNVFFEQFSFALGTREYVAYNPLDQQTMTSHAADVLQLSPGELALERSRGHYAVRDAGRPHWKYFLFD